MAKDGLVHACVRCKRLSRGHWTLQFKDPDGRLNWQATICHDCMEKVAAYAEDNPK